MEWQQVAFFCGILALWSGFIIATLKWMLDKSDRHMGERLEGVMKRVEEFKNDVHHQEIQLQAFKTEVAERYVSRDDWIRFAVTIEAKIDRLGGKLDAVR